MDEFRRTGNRLFTIVLVALTYGFTPDVRVAGEDRSASTAVHPVALSEEANENRQLGPPRVL